MIRNYLRTALRVLVRHAGFSAINLIGLSIGIGAALLLLLFVSHESGFDTHHDKADRIYRAWVVEDYGEGQEFFNTLTPVPLAPALRESIPELEAVVRYDRVNTTIRRQDVSLSEAVFLVDEAFLDVFDFEIRAGVRASLFARPDNIVLTESGAARYFGTADPVGDVLSLDFPEGPRQFEVSGVLADPPENSSLQFDFLLPYSVTDWYYPERMHQAWFNVSPETYVLLRDDAAVASLSPKLADLVRSKLGDRVEEGQYTVGLQPLLDIHTDTAFPPGYSTVIDPVYLRVLLAIALLVLAIACINFVTLSMSQSVGRSREIGVRKAIGADRSQIMAQYWGEAAVLTGLSLMAGLVIARVALPGFNALTGRPLTMGLDLQTVGIAFGLFLAVSAAAGLYPAAILSGFKPVDALKGSVGGRADRSLVRKGLVVAQFMLAILLTASALIVSSQLQFLRDKDLGFDKEYLVAIPTGSGSQETVELADRLRFSLASEPSIRSVSSATMLFDQAGWVRIGYGEPDGSYRRFFANVVDHDFVKTLGLRLAEGRDFDRNQPGDLTQAIIVNQAFVRAYGWDLPLTESIPGDFDDHQVIGVVEDFHYASLHTEVQPAIMALSQRLVFSGAQDADYAGQGGAKIAVRVSSDGITQSLATISEAWTKAAPDTPFSYSFTDEAIEAQYRQESRLSQVIGLGTLLAILIAGLGLSGLAAMSVARRTKEIGLRRVLGAGVAAISGLFVREFGLLVGVAFLLAAPVTFLVMNRWLDGFAYHTSVGVGPFLLAGAAAGVVTILVVSAQSVRAALSNPVDSLRDE